MFTFIQHNKNIVVEGKYRSELTFLHPMPRPLSLIQSTWKVNYHVSKVSIVYDYTIDYTIDYTNATTTTHCCGLNTFNLLLDFCPHNL